MTLSIKPHEDIVKYSSHEKRTNKFSFYNLLCAKAISAQYSDEVIFHFKSIDSLLSTDTAFVHPIMDSDYAEYILNQMKNINLSTKQVL